MWNWVRSLLLCLTLWSGFTAPAWASVHTYPEPTGMMQRSLQTLRDNSGQAWQIVLYKRVKPNQLDSLRLRLVGFPEQHTLARHQPLQIQVSTQQKWVVEDSTPPNLTANSAEYDVEPLLTQLPAIVPLQLKIPLQQGSVELTMPPFAVREWHQVANWRP